MTRPEPLPGWACVVGRGYDAIITHGWRVVLHGIVAACVGLATLGTLLAIDAILPHGPVAALLFSVLGPPRTLSGGEVAVCIGLALVADALCVVAVVVWVNIVMQDRFGTSWLDRCRTQREGRP